MVLPMTVEADGGVEVAARELPWARRAARFMLVMADVAGHWFAHHNTRNRSILPHRLEQIRGDMAAGRWVDYTGESIIFDRDAVLINGQHRLLALSQVGGAFMFLVVTGIEPDRPRAVIDRGGIRQIADLIELSGHGHLLTSGIGKNTVVGAYQAMRRGMGGARGKMTGAEVLAFMLRHQAAGGFALGEFARYPRSRRVYVAPAIAAVARAWYHCAFAPRMRLAKFVEVFAGGLCEREADRSALVWRNLLINAPLAANSNRADEIYGKTARVVLAFLRQERLARVLMPTVDPFPLPPREDA